MDFLSVYSRTVRTGSGSRSRFDRELTFLKKIELNEARIFIQLQIPRQEFISLIIICKSTIFDFLNPKLRLILTL